ncbi:MAG: TRAP transporter large permease [Pseudomonadota bacterium]
MTGLALAGAGFGLMLMAIFLRVPIAAAMGITGFLGTWVVLGTPNAVLSQLKTLPYDTFASYSLVIVPMFLLMGNIATRSGLSATLFQAAADMAGHRRGGLAMASVAACAGFGAVCGSSLATASTMGQVALPEMRRRGYSGSLSTGVLAAGGTLGILIPPSIILVIYAVLTEQNIVKLFAAALIPGLLAALGYVITVIVYVQISPKAAARGPRQPWHVRWPSLLRTWPVVLIFGLVMGGIVGDWDWTREGTQALFTPTEGAAFGLLATLLHGVTLGGLGVKDIAKAIEESAVATGFIFLVLLGAQLFNTFLAYTQAPRDLAEMILATGWAPMWIIIAMLATYLILGCVMDSLSMILLTLPIFFPIIEGLDTGLTPEQTALWFGVLTLIVVEVGLITPPVGLNLFIVNRLAKDVPITQTYRGVAPFVLSDLIRVGLILALPMIAVWLPGLIG